jgi:ribonuclease HI
MELTSCIMALKTLNPSKAIEIYTDSNYVYKCLEEEKWYIKWRKNNWKSSTKKAVENKDLWITLLDLYEGFKNIKIFKVEGHADNEGNIRADALANQGMDLGENIANV